MGRVIMTPPSNPSESEPADGGTTGVSLYGAAVEYAIHCLLWLAPSREQPASSRDLAELQGVSPAMVAKLMPKLEKAGIVSARDGVAGGYRLARSADEITVLDIVEAVDGGKRVFGCREVRLDCILFGGQAPAWAGGGTCSVHAVMLRAEKSMRREMAGTTLLDLANAVAVKAPPEFGESADRWLQERTAGRERARISAIRDGARRRAEER